jgi:anti-sigma B factor antagonist
MPDDRFPVEVLEGVPVVAAPEEIDITNAEALRSALLKVAANGHRTLVVDMTRTQFCDASGLHALAAAHQQTQAEGRELLLVIPGAAVLRVFALTGMDRVIPNFTSLAEALAFTDRRDHQPGLACEPMTHPGLAQATGVAAPAPGGGRDR